jgi:urease accessory protein
MRLVLALILGVSSFVAVLPVHAEVVQENSFVAGLNHPITGLDHIVVMIAVGVWGALAGGRALWVWPIAFVSTMLIGFIAAILGLSLPWTDAGVLSSVVVLALMVALAVQAPLWAGAALVGLFAFFHGHAHGTETAAASLPAFAAGFSVATAGLHGIGIALGRAAQGPLGRVTVRVMTALALVGVLTWAGS